MNTSTPKYRLHKPSGQAVVTLSGHDIYLGRFNTPQSRGEYDRIIAEWLTNGRRLTGKGSDLTVNEMLAAYVDFARTYYRQLDGQPTNEFNDTLLSVRPLRQLYGHSLARDFGPLALKAVRKEMIRSNLCRNEVNKRIGRVVRAFKWAVAEELVPADVHHGLQAVDGLKKGRSPARESEPVKPVPDAFVDAIQPYVLPPVWAMIQLQRLTGMRPGEVIQMRTCDLDTSGKVWTYRPATHKTAYRDQERIVTIGPRAQEILRPWLKVDLLAPLFSPQEAIAAQNQDKRKRRKSRVQPSQVCRRKAKPRRAPQEMYTVASYRRAIERGCILAFDMPKELRVIRKELPEAERKELRRRAAKWRAEHVWHPHQLRHNAGTWLRKKFSLDVARCVLGHRSSAVTETYAEMDFEKAADAIAMIG